MESKRKRRYVQGFSNNGAYAWTPYKPLPLRYAFHERRGAAYDWNLLNGAPTVLARTASFFPANSAVVPASIAFPIGGKEGSGADKERRK